MLGQYVNLFTDFGFKKIFVEDSSGEESSKAHLISFLSTLLPQKHQIQDLTFIQNEYQGATLVAERIFNSLFKQANIAKFKPEERIAYESSLKYYRDLTNVADTARDEGREEGYQKAQAEAQSEKQKLRDAMVLNMLQAGLPDSQVMTIAQITADELAAIKEQQPRY